MLDGGSRTQGEATGRRGGSYTYPCSRCQWRWWSCLAQAAQSACSSSAAGAGRSLLSSRDWRADRLRKASAPAHYTLKVLGQLQENWEAHKPVRTSRRAMGKWIPRLRKWLFCDPAVPQQGPDSRRIFSIWTRAPPYRGTTASVSIWKKWETTLMSNLRKGIHNGIVVHHTLEYYRV